MPNPAANTLTPERRMWILEATIGALHARQQRLIHLVGTDEELIVEDELSLINHEIIARTAQAGTI